MALTVAFDRDNQRSALMEERQTSRLSETFHTKQEKEEIYLEEGSFISLKTRIVCWMRRDLFPLCVTVKKFGTNMCKI